MIELQAPGWWEDVPILLGETLHLREVEAGDVAPLFELLTDPQVTLYISSPPPSATAFEGFIQWAHRQRAVGNCVCLAIVPNGLTQAIGLFQVRALEPTFKIAEWGFAMGSAFWSTGLFEEAAVLVAQFAIRTIGVHRLEARAVVENARGNRALEKIGARGEAVLRKAFNHDYAQFLWAIVAEEWTPPQRRIRTVFDAMHLKRQIERTIALQSLARPGPRPRFGLPSPFPFFLTDSTDPPAGS
jgi:RimJ/RimL family protein N-acetyltransferase